MNHYQNIFRYLFILLVLAWAVAATAKASAGEPVVTRYFTAIWDQPHQESQGLVLQIIDQESEDGRKKAAAYWFTYADDLETAWFMGVGVADGNQVVMDLYDAEGVAFMEADAPGDENVHGVGTLVLTFKNCNKGTAVYEIDELGSGEFEIQRLASLYNSRCSGGISDDTPGDARPVKLEVDLVPARADIDGSGESTYWERPDRSDFKVQVRGLADGSYTLKTSECGVDDEIEDDFEVFDGGGNVQYRSPESDGKRLLTFDPRGCRIEVLDGAGVVLTSGDALLEEKHPDDHGGGHGGGVGMSATTLELDNLSDFPEAEATAEYAEKNNSTEFEVEIERLPAGAYTLFVDHVERGMIDVVTDDDKTKGRIRFSDPQKEDREFLDFPVPNSLIEIENDGGDLMFEGTFPSG
jgi:hypothetical protein